jgi:dihydroorotase
MGQVSSGSGLRVRVVHVSSRLGLEAARQARSAGARLDLETCPHYLWCTEADYERLGGVLKFYPPVRTAEDQDALREGLRAGEIESVATDHAPHADAEKTGLALGEVGGGSPGVQTLLLGCLEQARRLGDPGLAVRWVAEGPARSLGIYPRKGAIQVGADADLVLVDPGRSTRFRAEDMLSRQKHGVLEGVEVPFAIRSVYSRGELVASDGRPVGSAGRGLLVRPAR